jgi:hypothetical protein
MMPLTNAERSKRKRDKKKANDLVSLNKYVTPVQKEEIEGYLAGELKMVEVKRVRNKRATVEDRDLQ